MTRQIRLSPATYLTLHQKNNANLLTALESAGLAFACEAQEGPLPVARLAEPVPISTDPHLLRIGAHFLIDRTTVSSLHHVQDRGVIQVVTSLGVIHNIPGNIDDFERAAKEL